MCSSLLFNSPLFLATLSSLTIAMNSFVVKILSQDYSVFQVVSFRGAIGLLILLSFMFWKGIYPLGPRNKVLSLIMRGILGATAIISSWIAIDLLPLSEASFLWNSYPIVTAVLASLTGMEKLNWMTWLGIGGTAIGNALVAHPPFVFGGHQEWGATRGVGLALSTLSVLAMGSTFIVVKMIGKNVHPFVHSTYQISCSVLISAPFLGASYPDKIKLPDGVLDSGLFVLVSLGSIVAQGVTVAALQRGSPTLVTAVMMTNMIYSSVLGMLVLSERFSLVSGSGAAIILVSVLLVVFGRGLSKKQEHKSPLQNEEEIELELDLIPNDSNQTNEQVPEAS